MAFFRIAEMRTFQKSAAVVGLNTALVRFFSLVEDRSTGGNGPGGLTAQPQNKIRDLLFHESSDSYKVGIPAKHALPIRQFLGANENSFRIQGVMRLSYSSRSGLMCSEGLQVWVSTGLSTEPIRFRSAVNLGILTAVSLLTYRTT